MLGHRAAVLIAIPSLAAFGGGVALAAGHGSSHSSKPQVHKVVRPHKAGPNVVRSEHHCHFSGQATASQL